MGTERRLTVVVNPHGPAFDWVSQKAQYPASGQPGITYMAGPTEWGDVNCLLLYDRLGLLRGTLNHYPFDAPPLECKGGVNIFVDPTYRRRGVATALLTAAMNRWRIDLERQTYTPEGVEFLKGYLARRK